MTLLTLSLSAAGAIFWSSHDINLDARISDRLQALSPQGFWYLLMVPFVVAPGFGILLAAIDHARLFPIESSAFTITFWSGLIPPLLFWATAVFVQIRVLNRRHDMRLFS